MTMWEMIAERARELPVEKQREVLDFVEFLRVHEAPKHPLRDVAGLFKGIRYLARGHRRGPARNVGRIPA
jgi:hypothetical protein